MSDDEISASFEASLRNIDTDERRDTKLEEANINDIQLKPLAEEDLKQLVDHETLKYHLLGPSLTKAGQDSVDQQKVSEVIYNASKGSKFFSNEEVKDKNLTQKINRILARKRLLDSIDLSSDRRRADEQIAELELSRDLSQHVVHIDCDAFYAAVEELDRPELKHVPMAVGKGVLTTCNYHARKFGCRSGMAGFVAMKLCPELICLPLNFEKYTAKAQEVRTILAEYDPRFESSSIDEAYLNITEYCQTHDIDPVAAVSQLRAEVQESTKITISAGIAANGRLAKICSNRNKPNGQYLLPSDRPSIMSFMSTLPTRKVNGIGRVFERELDAIGIQTCGDIYDHRAILTKLFGFKAFHFLMTVYLGIGRTKVQPAEEYERKSVGTESTFRDMSDPAELREKLQWIACELEKDMQRTQFKGRTLCLKIKLHTYEVLTRQVVPPHAVCKKEDLFKYAEPMLAKLASEIPGMTLRLMGLRCTHLVSTKKEDINFFGLRSHPSDPNAQSRNADSEGEWEVWPDSAFDEQSEPINDDASAIDITPRRPHGREILPNPTPPSLHETSTTPKQDDQTYVCPLCSRRQEADDRAFNTHIDYCLSKQTIHDVVKETSAVEAVASPVSAPLGVRTSNAATSRKRRKARSTEGTAEEREAKKLFFTRAL